MGFFLNAVCIILPKRITKVKITLPGKENTIIVLRVQ